MSNIIKAIQEIYPDIEGGFVYWETKQDGTPLDNPEDGLIWENIEYSKPLWSNVEAKLNEVDLQEAKDAKTTEIEQARKDYQYSNITFEGNDYLATFTAQTKFYNLLSLSTGDIDWRLADCVTWITLTQTQAIALKDVIIARESAAYQHESTKIIDINNAIDVEAVNAIDWTL